MKVIRKMKKRYHDIDLIRVLCVIFLPLIHVTEFWGLEDSCGGFLVQSFNDVFYYPCFILTSFVAPVFMFTMGINMCLSKKNSAKALLNRGIFFLIIELILNFFRYALPGFIGIIFSPNNEVRKNVLSMIGYGMINSDILAFAGLAFIIFAIFKKLKLKPIYILLISLALYLINELLIINLLSPILDNNLHYMVNNLLGNFIYINSDSTFSLLEWLIVVALGYALGNYFIINKEDNKITKSYALFSMIGLILSAIVIIISILVDNRNIFSIFSHNINHTRMDYVCLITNITICIILLFIGNLIYKTKKIKENERFNNFIVNFSININSYYIIQWILVGFVMFICGGVGLWGSHNVIAIVGILGIIFITIASYFLAPFINKIKDILDNKLTKNK